MKPQVDLYLLTADTFSGCFPFACLLIEKTYRQGHTAVVHLESAEAGATLDQLLWTFRDASFVPHQLCAPTAITVGKAPLSSSPPSLAIHCRLLETPVSFNEQRLLQIVPNHPQLLQLARQHYRFYQQQGYSLATHRIQ